MLPANRLCFLFSFSCWATILRRDSSASESSFATAAMCRPFCAPFSFISSHSIPREVTMLFCLSTCLLMLLRASLRSKARPFT